MEISEQERLLPSGMQVEKPFIFVGDALALDVVNTEKLVKGVHKDFLSSPAMLMQWWQQVQMHYPELELEYGSQDILVVDQSMLEAFKEFRAALRHLFEDMLAEHAILDEHLAPLNAVLKMGTQVVEQGESGTFRLRDQPGTLPQARLLFPIVRSAIWLLTEGTTSRLRLCNNTRCRVFFYDRTRSATRHWCCLKCMDRARSARRYQQSKEQRTEA